MKQLTFLIFIFLIIILGTSSLYSQNKTNTSNNVKNLIEKKRSFNKQYGYGYRVQVYYGDETKARSTESKFKINFPNVFIKLDYEQPYWKVQVGNYKTKLEADKAVINFSEKFSGLIVIPLGK
jgi:septal ring-binding cell division protein DamX